MLVRPPCFTHHNGSSSSRLQKSLLVPGEDCRVGGFVDFPVEVLERLLALKVHGRNAVVVVVEHVSSQRQNWAVRIGRASEAVPGDAGEILTSERLGPGIAEQRAGQGNMDALVVELEFLGGETGVPRDHEDDGVGHGGSTVQRRKQAKESRAEW